MMKEKPFDGIVKRYDLHFSLIDVKQIEKTI